MTAKFFDTFCFMVLENQGWNQVQNCKFIDYFLKNGTVCTSWHGVTHPSGPNYRAMFSGQTWSNNEFDGVRRDNIAQYVPTVVSSFKGDPAQRHNPFLDMDTEHQQVTGWPPVFLPITYLGMDDGNNAHSGPLEVADNNVLEALKLLEHRLGDTRFLFMVTFDEGFGQDYQNNHVFTGFLGGSIKTQLLHDEYNHYHLAHYLADNFGVNLPPEAEKISYQLRL